MKKLLICLLWMLLPLNCFAADTDDVKAVKSAMTAMTDTWNQGDMNDFLKYYKNSDSATYVSSKIISGFKNISQRYEDRYPANDVMGKLSISNLKIRILSPTFAMAIGNWSQVREDTGTKNGTFSLLWEKTHEGWKIVVDHTS
jgi:ketosteroid isomerase-like protein